jgi:hypothetical protein
VTRKGWQPVCRKVIGETHHRTFIAAVHAQANLSADHPNDVRDRRLGSHRHHLTAPRNTVQAVVAMKARLRVTRRDTQERHLRRDAEQGGT